MIEHIALYVTSFLFFFTCFLLLIRKKNGIIFYLFLLLLVPKLPFFLRFNLVNLILIVFCILPKTKLLSIRCRPLKGFYIYLIVLLLFIPFQQSCPFYYQIYVWVKSFLNTFLAVSILLFFSEQNNLKKLNFSLIIIILFVCLYAVYLVPYRGTENPWVMIFNPETYSRLPYNWLVDFDRPFGRISSVYSHPMLFGAVIICFFFFCLYLFFLHKKLIKTLSGFCIFLILFCSILCGARSCIVAISFGIGLFLFYNRIHFRLFFYCILFSTILVVIYLFYSDNINNSYFFSVFSVNSSYVGGSSLAMRLNQLISCFETTDNIIFGNGYKWSSFYLENFGVHPFLLAFESKIFTVICNSGILGVLVWISFLIYMHCYQTKLYRQGYDNYRILLCFFWSFQAYICLTGDYDYTFLWLTFYSLLIVNMRSLKHRLCRSLNAHYGYNTT